jgi:hypothetical protein
LAVFSPHQVHGAGLAPVIVKYKQGDITKTIYMLNVSIEEFTLESGYSWLPNHHQLLQRTGKISTCLLTNLDSTYI